MKKNKDYSDIILDAKDRKLLLELYSEERVFNTELSKRLMVSKEVLGYRLKRLHSEGILKRTMPIVDYSSLGYHIYRLQLSFNSISAEDKKLFKGFLMGFKDLGWLVELSGHWDLVAGFLIRNTEDFESIYQTIFDKYGKLIKNKLFTIVRSIVHFSPNYIQSGQRKVFVTGKNHAHHNLDENTKKILKVLFEDSRVSLSEISKKLNLSLSTVKYHLQLLHSRKIILGYRPVIDIAKLGYEHFKIVVELNDVSQKNMAKEILSNDQNVVYITESLGKYDLEFEAEFKSINEVFELIERMNEQVLIKDSEILFSNKEIVINEVI